MPITLTPPRSNARDSGAVTAAASDHLTSSGQRIADPARPGRAGALLIGAAVTLVPWTLALWARLPAEGASPTGRLLWVTIDGLEALGLLSSGILVRRGSRWQPIPLALTGALLLADAGIDVLTSASTERGWALALLTIELPLAGWCLRRAGRARQDRLSPCTLALPESAAPQSVRSRARSMMGEECVSPPTETKSTPVAA